MADIPSPIRGDSFVATSLTIAASAHKLNSDALNPDFQVARLQIEAFEYAQAEVLCAESRFPQHVYRDLLIDDDRQHADTCLLAMAVEHGTSIPTFLID